VGCPIRAFIGPWTEARVAMAGGCIWPLPSLCHHTQLRHFSNSAASLAYMGVQFSRIASFLVHLKSTKSYFDDPHVDAKDLAFCLISHGFDATPIGSYAVVDLGGDIYKLAPNGAAPGLASIVA